MLIRRRGVGWGCWPHIVHFHGSSVPVPKSISVRLQPLLQVHPKPRCYAFFLTLRNNILYPVLFFTFIKSFNSLSEIFPEEVSWRTPNVNNACVNSWSLAKLWAHWKHHFNSCHKVCNAALITSDTTVPSSPWYLQHVRMSQASSIEANPRNVSYLTIFLTKHC